MLDWTAYWMWLGFAILLAILEMIAPGHILLGFAVSAGIISGAFFLGGWPAQMLSASLPVTLIVFAVLALVVWLVLRHVFKLQRGQVKIWDRDINED